MGKLTKEAYAGHLRDMQAELNDMARWIKETGQRMLIIFEGRDTAGKGGAIRAVSERLNPRMCHTVALARPSERESTQMYVQRYVRHLPAGGEIVLFDRSWYNRAGVERVMGYCTEKQARSFLDRIPRLERAITDDGVLLFKYYLTCDQGEQEKRLQERLSDPPEALEAVADRPRSAREISGLHPGAGGDAESDPHQVCALDPGQLQ
jgi:polyphosphate kinase 2 (PPK2 family)